MSASNMRGVARQTVEQLALGLPHFVSVQIPANQPVPACGVEVVPNALLPPSTGAFVRATQ
jgi:hypothetical protein